VQEELFEGHVTKLPFGSRGRVRFVVLLAAFGLLFLYDAVAPALGIDTKSQLSRVLSFLTISVLLGAAALAASAGRATLLAVRAFLLFGLVMLLTGRYTRGSDFFDVVAHLSIAGFVAWVSLLIIRNVWTLRQANAEAIAAALCAFLMLGLLWTLIYSLIGHLDPEAFGGRDLTIGGAEPGLGFYFSFVTLTTLGYGDISPQTPSARTLALLEAIVGQIFLVVLVARLVGLSIVTAQSSNRDSAD
jgi:hypothetical protein